jgi:methionyl-tRNA formyltransferase
MLRIVFMGTPDFAVPALEAIVAAGHQVVAVYTQPPRPAGRGMAARQSPVHICASRRGLPVHAPATLRGEEPQRTFVSHGADAGVVVAYGLILPGPVLRAPRYGCLNLHASLLPRWRGAAPIQRAIMAGDAVTGACVMRMEEGLDTGPVCAVHKIAIGPDMTAGELHDALARDGAALMVAALQSLARGALTCTAQPGEGVTYAAKLGAGEQAIDFARSAREVHDHVRGLSPFPGAWFAVRSAHKERDGDAGANRIKVLRSRLAEGLPGAPGTVLSDKPGLVVACGSGAVELLELQRPGKRPMPAAEVLRGFPLPPGTRLGGR